MTIQQNSPHYNVVSQFLNIRFCQDRRIIGEGFIVNIDEAKLGTKNHREHHVQRLSAFR